VRQFEDGHLGPKAESTDLDRAFVHLSNGGVNMSLERTPLGEYIFMYVAVLLCGHVRFADAAIFGLPSKKI
jgi:hypothetical protein